MVVQWLEGSGSEWWRRCELFIYVDNFSRALMLGVVLEGNDEHRYVHSIQYNIQSVKVGTNLCIPLLVFRRNVDFPSQIMWMIVLH